MANSTIKYYPVGNGDSTLLTVENGVTILVDCNIRLCDDENCNYDVKKDLQSSLKKKKLNDVDDVSFVEVFILTHGDDDHLHGFEKHFYQGDPTKYKKKNKDDGEILIDTLWFTPMVMGTATNEDEKCFNKEAKRRIQLHRDKSSDKDLPGNRILIIGKDANEDLTGLNLVRRVPGEIVTRFNDKDLKTFSIFIHSPYQDQLTDEEVDKNRVSLVFQARFKATDTSKEFCGLAMFGGDSDHEAWKTILAKTKKHKNDTKEHALKWDLFMACHHCSWTFFNNTPQKDNPKPVTTSLEVLDNRRSNGKVIASSKEIKNNDDNPPSYAAKKEYEKKVGADKFLNTETHQVSGKTPQPIIFEITQQGPMQPKKKEGTANVVGAASLGALKQPSTYGSK